MKAKSLNFLGHSRVQLGKKKRKTSGLVPTSEPKPFIFLLLRTVSISVAFMWRKTSVRRPLYTSDVCVFPGGDVLPWSLCRDLQGQAWVMLLEDRPACNDGGDQTVLSSRQ